METGGSAMSTTAPKNVDEYLARIPEPARTTLNQVRAGIRSAMPAQATETISYGIPTLEYKGSQLWFAAFKNHCSVFPGASVIKQFKNELKDFHTSKGTIRFSTDRPIPDALLKKLVRARIAENEK
jgi:uncharacterized protein YdhG (YjbR/CyaY superfamily)